MIALGGLVNKADRYGRTPLFIASRNGYLPIIKALIAYGADFDPKNDIDETPIDVAFNNEFETFIFKEIRWYLRRSLILTRPHDD